MVLSIILKLMQSGWKLYWVGIYALIVSLMMYATFHVMYLPPSEHTLDVHFVYKTGCDSASTQELCSFPTANVKLHRRPHSKEAKNAHRVLTRGQGYDVSLELDMPLSDINQNLGMFLIQLEFLHKDNSVVDSHSRSGLLNFQSSLLQTMSTVFYIVPLLTGWKEERQKLNIPLVENYIDDSYSPTFSINVTLHSKRIQIYGAKLRLKALFTGLRYYMHHWPMTFSAMGFTFVLSSVFLVSLFRFIRREFVGDDENRPRDLTSMAIPEDDYGNLSDSSGDEGVNDVINNDVTTVEDINTQPEQQLRHRKPYNDKNERESNSNNERENNSNRERKDSGVDDDEWTRNAINDPMDTMGRLMQF